MSAEVNSVTTLHLIKGQQNLAMLYLKKHRKSSLLEKNQGLVVWLSETHRKPLASIPSTHTQQHRQQQQPQTQGQGAMLMHIAI